jgi:hypothetical protein
VPETGAARLTLFHPVIAAQALAVVFLERRNFSLGGHMKALFKLLIPISLFAMSGCVVAPYGYHRGYWYGGPRVAVVAPLPVLAAPVLVIRP